MNNERTDAEIVIKTLSDVIKGRIARPIYLKIEHREGDLSIEQVEYLTPDELAQLMRVEARTVYSWFDKGVLGFCKPAGTGQNLISLRSALAWIDSSVGLKEPKIKKEPPPKS
ncbi:MAG TPA: helix-turn-helix domain-containing protein [Blastocatellia bacterium]|nr:helix-turn-helix domain-containing protein [Blastocatellia bacterium]